MNFLIWDCICSTIRIKGDHFITYFCNGIEWCISFCSQECRLFPSLSHTIVFVLLTRVRYMKRSRVRPFFWLIVLKSRNEEREAPLWFLILLVFITERWVTSWEWNHSAIFTYTHLLWSAAASSCSLAQQANDPHGLGQQSLWTTTRNEPGQRCLGLGARDPSLVSHPDERLWTPLIWQLPQLQVAR